MEKVGEDTKLETEEHQGVRRRGRDIFKEWKIKWDEPLIKPLGRILTWLLFSVAIALAPVFCSYLVSPAIKQAFSFEKFASHGELAAISIALTGEALGYLLTNRNVRATFRGIVGFGGVLVFAGELILLVLVSVENLAERIGFDPTYVSELSVRLFIGTLIVGVFCKWTEK